MAGEIAGAIGTTARKPRAAKKSLQALLAEDDAAVERAHAKWQAAIAKRSKRITDAKLQVEARAAELARLDVAP